MSNLAPIIIKKKKVISGGGHHGGAWKVAYADFVTAMMAFFLLMWLLNATSEDQRKGLADFFDPSIPISRNSAGGAGMLKGDTALAEDEAAGSQTEGVRPERNAQNPGADLGDQTQSPDGEDGSEPGAAPSGSQAGAMDGRGEGDAGDRLAELAGRLQTEIETAGGGSILRHFSVRITPDGMVIEIADLTSEPLFAPGASLALPLLQQLMSVLVPVLAQTTNPIAISGHTDASPMSGAGGYTNWELSVDRAAAARRLMIDLGLDPGRVARISGAAATNPIAEDPLSPRNRRIAITLLRNRGPN